MLDHKFTPRSWRCLGGKVLVSAAMTIAMLATCAAAEGPAIHPNIVLVLIDDMGWADLSCFGNTEIATTNIDRLASEGLRFEQFYVNSPICSPSRVAISTGQYPARWRITSFLNNRKENERRGMDQWLDPKAPMLARILHDAGYATGHFGKWHLGGQRDVGDAPPITQYGFDESLTNFEGLGPRVLPLLDAFDDQPPKKHALGSDTLPTGPIQWQRRDKVTTSYANAAIDFIDRAQSGKRPFYINVWPDDVHSPFFPPKDRRGNESKRELYLGVLKTLDDQLGPLFDRIRNDAALRDNTLVMLCSDNGPEDGAGSAGPFRGRKATLYEGGIRSPLVVWGPGLINNRKAGTANRSTYLSAIDLVPSLIEIAGVPKPAGKAFDGLPMADVLLAKSERSRGAPLFFRRPPDRPNHSTESNLPDLAVRDGNWKLLCEYDGSKPQLFNLQTDRSEANNLADKKQSIVERLTTSALDWNRSMPNDNGASYLSVRKVRIKPRSLNKAAP
jgi:uncharacterized sulfatase